MNSYLKGSQLGTVLAMAVAGFAYPESAAPLYKGLYKETRNQGCLLT